MGTKANVLRRVIRVFQAGFCVALLFTVVQFSPTGFAGAADGIASPYGATAAEAKEAQRVLTSEELAEHYFPQKIWFHPMEFCAWPATRRNPGVAVYSVRSHPGDPDSLAITYSILYRNDCGGFLGVEKHPGDVESFSCTLTQDNSCPTGWRLFSVKTTAHGAEPGNVAARIMNSCEPLPELFVSLKKHGTYLSMERCNAYFDPSQSCEMGFAPDFILVNAGSPDNRLADDLSGYFPSEPMAPTEYIWSGDGRFCGGQWVEDRAECVGAPGLKLTDDSLLASVHQPALALIGLGDSLTHGTMDATNNTVNTRNAYLQKVADSLGQVAPLSFNQPLFDEAEKRISPWDVPTNLGVDGSDVFSLEGLEYYKRAGAEESVISTDLLCDKWSPRRLKDKYDKVLYPINVLNWGPVSQLDSTVWLLNEGLAFDGISRALVILWIGNNDSSKAALGAGGKNPEFQPLPFDIIKKELNPLLSLLLGSGQAKGLVSFEPYTLSAIERNLTELNDFAKQYVHILDRVAAETASSGISYDLFALTLPYYSAVGYLMDSEDLEFYLRKVKPWYRVPPSFKRVAPRGEPITDFLKGDRISLLTFGMMYALLDTGHSVKEVNKVLEEDGKQRDGLVLSEEEQKVIMARIDGYNEAIRAAAAAAGPKVHLVDIGQYLNDVFLGKEGIEVDGRVFNRKWIRGNGFCFDGVHPGYTGHALLSNFILEKINEVLGLNAPAHNLSEILAMDPYIDRDGDGWAAGPDYEGPGITKLLYLFKDPDDADALVQPVMPPDVWEMISDVLLGEMLHIPAMRASAEKLGLIPAGTSPR